MSKTVVLCHGRHVDTVGWKALVWGEGDKIGTAPLALYLAVQNGAQLVFGTGASEKDGLKECAFTRQHLKNHLAELTTFPEFSGYCADGPYELDATFNPIVDAAHLDLESQNTDQEVVNAVEFAKSVGATELIQVTSPFHAARCMNVVAKLCENGFDFGNVIPRVVSARSSTATCRAATTVILEHPHRGDDPMIEAPMMPHQVFPRMFRLSPSTRMQFFSDTSRYLKELGV